MSSTSITRKTLLGVRAFALWCLRDFIFVLTLFAIIGMIGIGLALSGISARTVSAICIAAAVVSPILVRRIFGFTPPVGAALSFLAEERADRAPDLHAQAKH